MPDISDQQTAQEVEKTRATRARYGVYSGLVENINDPEGLGRMQVRVWAVHGPESRTPTACLPWSRRSEPSGGSLDSGSSGGIAAGATVDVQFEQGIEDYPVVTGTFRGKPVADAANPQTVKNPDGLPYKPADGQSETPKEVFDDRHKGAVNPTVQVPFKSQKGAGLMVDDADGREKMRMVDRAGQGLEFYAPGSKDANRGSGCNNGNAAQRGARTAFRGDQLPQEALKRRTGHARLKDTAGQEILLEGKDQAERIRLTSRDARGTSSTKLELRSGRGREGATLQDKNGSRLELDPNGARAVNLQDAEGNRVSMIPGGSLELASITDLRLQVGKNRSSQVVGTDTAEVGGDRVDNILGNLKTQVAGGIATAAMGSAQLTLGGLLQLLITNAPQPGVPPTAPTPLDMALDVSVAIGGVRFKLPLGTFKVQSLVGSVILECGATLGVDKVLLGGGLASEPVVCGNILVALLLTMVTGLLAHTHPTPAGPSLPSADLVASLASVLAALQGSQADPTHVSPTDPLSSTVAVEKLHVPTP